MSKRLQQHERVRCVIAGFGVGSTIWVPMNATGEIQSIDAVKHEAIVQFDDPGVLLRVPLSHLRTENHVQGTHE
jgi:hypothetical protein